MKNTEVHGDERVTSKLRVFLFFYVKKMNKKMSSDLIIFLFSVVLRELSIDSKTPCSPCFLILKFMML